jgi:hypothetical protein
VSTKNSQNPKSIFKSNSEKMKPQLNKIAKPIAIGIFFIALFFNVKVTLQDPFIRITNEVVAQTNSSAGGCFTKFASNCPSGPGGIGGGQRVTCDKTGTFINGETCTAVRCVTGTTEQEICTQNP